MARLLALSALILAAASAAAGAAPPARARAHHAGTAARTAPDLDDASDLGAPRADDVPVHAVPASLSSGPPAPAYACRACFAPAGVRATGLPLLAFAPKTSPPPPSRVRQSA